MQKRPPTSLETLTPETKHRLLTGKSLPCSHAQDCTEPAEGKRLGL